MAKAKTCQICGKPGFLSHPLCREHWDMRDTGKIVVCPDCGQWHPADSPCKCSDAAVYTSLPSEGFNKCLGCGAKTNGYAFCRQCWWKYSTEEMLELLNKHSKKMSVKSPDDDEPNDDEPVNKVVSVNEDSKSKCIVCGKQAAGLLFCLSCYKKYKNKGMLFRISNGTDAELIETDYTGNFTCRDGHVVKSRSEREIDNYLSDHGIAHDYEKELSYGTAGKVTWQPSFVLPNYLGEGKDVYIQHWGYNENNMPYHQSKKYKLPIYKNLKVTLVCINEKSDMENLDAVLANKLDKANIKEGTINFDE